MWLCSTQTGDPWAFLAITYMLSGSLITENAGCVQRVVTCLINANNHDVGLHFFLFVKMYSIKKYVNPSKMEAKEKWIKLQIEDNPKTSFNLFTLFCEL